MKAYATEIFESVKAKQEGDSSGGKGGKKAAVSRQTCGVLVYLMMDAHILTYTYLSYAIFAP